MLTKSPAGISTPEGAQKLQRAASRALEEDCEKIAAALANSCKEGHIQSIKFVYELASLAEELGHGDGAVKLRNLAKELADQPQWTGEWIEEDAEPTADNLGPEDREQLDWLRADR
jgi:hypothetical protein